MVKISNKILQTNGEYIDNDSHAFIFRIINANFTPNSMNFYVVFDGIENRLSQSVVGDDIELIWNFTDDIKKYKLVKVKIVGKTNGNIVWQTNNSIDIPILKQEIKVSYNISDLEKRINEINNKLTSILSYDYIEYEDLKDLVSIEQLKEHINNMDLSKYVQREDIDNIIDKDNIVTYNDINNFASTKFVYDLIENISIPAPVDLSDIQAGIELNKKHLKKLCEEIDSLCREHSLDFIKINKSLDEIKIEIEKNKLESEKEHNKNNHRYEFEWESSEFDGLSNIFVTNREDKIAPYNYSKKEYLMGCVINSEGKNKLITSGRCIVRDDGSSIVGKFCHPNIDGVCSNHTSGFMVLKRINDSQIEILI